MLFIIIMIFFFLMIYSYSFDFFGDGVWVSQSFHGHFGGSNPNWLTLNVACLISYLKMLEFVVILRAQEGGIFVISLKMEKKLKVEYANVANILKDVYELILIYLFMWSYFYAQIKETRRVIFHTWRKLRERNKFWGDSDILVGIVIIFQSGTTSEYLKILYDIENGN